MRTLAPIDSRRSLEAVELDYDGQSSQELVQNPGVSSIFPAPSMSYRALPLLEADLSRQFYGSRCMGLVPSSPLLIQDYLNGNVLISGEFVLPQVQKLVLFIKVCQYCQCYHPHRLTNILWPRTTRVTIQKYTQDNVFRRLSWDILSQNSLPPYKFYHIQNLRSSEGKFARIHLNMDAPTFEGLHCYFRIAAL